MGAWILRIGLLVVWIGALIPTANIAWSGFAYWPFVLVASCGGFLLLLEMPAHQKSLTFAFQYLAVRFIIGALFAGLGIFLIYGSLIELGNVNFFTPQASPSARDALFDAAIHLLRNTGGHYLVVFVAGSSGVLCALAGLKIWLRGLAKTFPRKQLHERKNAT